MDWWEDYFDEVYLKVYRHIGLEDGERIGREVDFIERALNLKEGMDVLDVGCGQGRHAVELSLRGYRVVGLDYSDYLLSVAVERGRERGADVRFVKGDMRFMDFDGQFDAAFLFFTTFGYFDDDENFRVLKNISRALRRGGRLLIDLSNPFRILDNMERRSWLMLEDGSVYLEELRLNPESMRVDAEILILKKGGESVRRRRSVRIYTPAELLFLMELAGIRKVALYGDYDFSPFGRQSRRLIVVGEKDEVE